MMLRLWDVRRFVKLGKVDVLVLNVKKPHQNVVRMKAVGGGKQEPVEYKDRADIGSQRQRSEREQTPEKRRGVLH
jgi:hypothetical protein